jgi:tol-pal system protein YbgF
MKSFSQTVKLLTSLFFLITLVSCTATQQTSEQLVNLQIQMSDLHKSRTDSNSRMEELNNKLFLIQKKIEANAKDIHQLSSGIEDLKSQALIATPPEELDTYSMAPLTLKEEKEIKTSESDKPSIKTPVIDDQKTIKKPAKKVQTLAKAPSQNAKSKEKSLFKGTESPEDIYKKAYTLFEKRSFSESYDVFNHFLQRFPDHLLSDNAQYWIGEVFYSQRDFRRSITEFSKVLDIFPKGNKAPDALFKMSLSYEALQDESAYINTLKRLVAIYPTSSVALKAQEKLKVLEP